MFATWSLGVPVVDSPLPMRITQTPRCLIALRRATLVPQWSPEGGHLCLDLNFIVIVIYSQSGMDLTRMAATLVSSLPLGPLEIPVVYLEPCNSLFSAIAARLVCPSATSFVLTSVPPCLLINRPLDMEFSAIGLDAGSASSVVQRISLYAHMTIFVEILTGQSLRVPVSPVSVQSMAGGWILRALIHPASWANVASVTLVSLSLAGHHFPCSCLPVTLRVGYNHASAPAGAVVVASKAGNVSALQAALDAGGSTEEADEVSDARGEGGLRGCDGRCHHNYRTI